MLRGPAILLVVVTALAVLAGPLAAPAVAATAPTILVQRLDPLQTAPVSLQVSALTADGAPAAFTGAVTLSVGRTAAVAAVTSTGDAPAVARIDTTALQAGLATLRARLVIGGRARTLVLRWFAEIAPPLAVRGYSCAAVAPGGGTIRWAVERMAGEPVRTPNSRDVDLLPYVASSTRRASMTGTDGEPLTTSGTVTLLEGTTRVAVRRLPAQVRRLVFGVAWDGKVRGAFRPGVYTARLVLKDAAGGTTTAEQQVVVGPAAASPCGS